MSEPANNLPNQPKLAFTLPRAVRIWHKRDYERIFANRCKASDARLIVYAAANEVGLARFGLAIAVRLGSAVVRNRHKRMLREAFRLQRHNLPRGFDFLLVPLRQAGRAATLAELQASLQTLAPRAADKARRHG